ncbi:DUF4258 domain-containing protein [Polyangium sp. 6x1]|uniref:DUF4258 domain-containing protein n=1 Tax=Polyangium sp. 6x1 TaxID=3042689 RepID=UPI0024827386|nr:DUF4258 domain-containing protein [Polyangium sp. 6x1]MDI1447791.1 DUF4258 domain-containing protein [Polyangium sp. 6x1]
MPDPRLLPPDPLAFVQRCVRSGSILWTHHVNMRFGQRRVTRDMVLDAVDSFEIIEAYPDDKYLPSYLVRGEQASSVFHVLFAVDVAEENVRVVTAYLPDPAKWDPGFRRRRQRP